MKSSTGTAGSSLNDTAAGITPGLTTDTFTYTRRQTHRQRYTDTQRDRHHITEVTTEY